MVDRESFYIYAVFRSLDGTLRWLRWLDKGERAQVVSAVSTVLDFRL